jgi:hypothetical protein
MPFPLLPLSAVLLSFAAQAGTPTPVTLTNPSFEGNYLPVGDATAQIGGLVANGWQDNSSWANVAVRYSQETNNPHSGTSCQKISVTSVTSGQVQLVQSFPVVGGSLYTASFWVRGEAGTQVIVEVQQVASPYAAYLDGGATLASSAWQQVTVQGYITARRAGDHLGGRRIGLLRPRKLWSDPQLGADSNFFLRDSRRKLHREHPSERRFRATFRFHRDH